MKRLMQVCAIMALGSIASASPYSVYAVRVIGYAEGGFHTSGLVPFIADGGVFWDATLSSSPAADDIRTSTLVGAHPNHVPEGDPDSATLVGVRPIIAIDPLSGDGDTSFDIAFSFQPPGVVQGNFIWIGQVFAADPQITLELMTGADEPAEVTEQGGFDPFTGNPIGFQVEPIFGHDDAYHIFIGFTIPRNHCPADFSNSGTVDIVDFAVFAEAFGSSEGDPNYNPQIDLNQSGSIDIVDFESFVLSYGETDCFEH